MTDVISCTNRNHLTCSEPRECSLLKMNVGNRSWPHQEVTLQGNHPRLNESPPKECPAGIHFEMKVGHWPSMVANWFLARSANQNHLESIFPSGTSVRAPLPESLDVYFLRTRFSQNLIHGFCWESSIKWVFELFSFLPSPKFSGFRLWQLLCYGGQTECFWLLRSFFFLCWKHPSPGHRAFWCGGVSRDSEICASCGAWALTLLGGAGGWWRSQQVLDPWSPRAQQLGNMVTDWRWYGLVHLRIFKTTEPIQPWNITWTLIHTHYLLKVSVLGVHGTLGALKPVFPTTFSKACFMVALDTLLKMFFKKSILLIFSHNDLYTVNVTAGEYML